MTPTAAQVYDYLAAHYAGRMQAPGWVPAHEFGDYSVSVVRRYDNQFGWSVNDRDRVVAKGRVGRLAEAWWAGCEAIAKDLAVAVLEDEVA